MLLMNQSSADRFADEGASGCLVIANSSLCRPRRALNAVLVPATAMAQALGDTRGANFVMLGAYLARKPWVPPEAVEAGIREAFKGKPPQMIDLNLRALREGLEVGGAGPA